MPNQLPKSLPNLVKVEGPNSSGKSTLLNIIAAAFYGLQNQSIHRSLMQRLRNLVESDHQTVEFSVTILGQEGAATDGRAAYHYLDTQWRTIAGGTSEVVRNLIAQHGLGLPRG